MESEVLGVPGGPECVVSVSRVSVGPRTGESACESECRVEAKERPARDLRGEALRRGSELFVESKLPCEMPWRQVMMRSIGGCVEMLSRRDRLEREIMLFGRPIFEPARFIDVVSQASLRRMRFANAQSCLNTFKEPV